MLCYCGGTFRFRSRSVKCRGCNLRIDLPRRDWDRYGKVRAAVKWRRRRGLGTRKLRGLVRLGARGRA